MIAPTSEAELAEAIASAKGPLRIVGGATKLSLGGMSQGILLSTAGLSGVVLYEPAALTLVAQAGTLLSEIEALLAANDQRLAFEPMDYCGVLGSKGQPTIGGIVACNVSGPRRIQAGACRDFLIGARFVDGMGNVIKSGGRVMKNVTGLDLVKLVAGSFGTLGVISEVAFKVLPKPEIAADLAIAGLADDRAIAALAMALGSAFEVTGAAHLPGKLTLIRLEGFADSVTYRVGKLRGLLVEFGSAEVRTDQAIVADAWREVRDVRGFVGKIGAVWRVSVKPSHGPKLVARLREKAPEIEAIYDWGGGLVWLLVPETGDAMAGMIRVNMAGGHASLVRAKAETRQNIAVFQPEIGEIARISTGLRQKFDPRFILNRNIIQENVSRETFS